MARPTQNGGGFVKVLQHSGEQNHIIATIEKTGRFHRAADVFVFPSLYEGLGIAVLEAMAMGVAVVAYDTGPLSEVVVHGETGMLVPSGDAEELADGVEALVQAPEKSEVMGAVGRKRVEKEFLVARTAARHAEFYHQLVGRHDRRSYIRQTRIDPNHLP